jgi:hypothetical protein
VEVRTVRPVFTPRRCDVPAHVRVRPIEMRMAVVLETLRLAVHRHRVEPEVSAYVAFPSCRCGALIWPGSDGPAVPVGERLA